MYLQNIEQYYIVKEIISASEENPVSSFDLSEYLHISTKTVQSYINDVIPFCEKNGFTVASKIGQGYFPVVNDEQKVHILRKELVAYFQMYFPYGEVPLRNIYISIFLLDSAVPVSINEIGDKFAVSKTTAYLSINYLKESLGKSGLSIKTDTNNKIFIIGSELHKRLFASRILSTPIYKYNAIDYLNNDHYQRIIDYENGKLKELSLILSNYNLSLNQTCSFWLQEYLNFANYRSLLNFKIDNDFSDNICVLKEFFCAQDIVHKFSLNLNDKDEIKAIAVFLICFNDSVKENSSERFGNYCSDIKQLYEYLNDTIVNVSSYFTEIKGYEDNLFSLACHIFFMHEFGIYDCEFEVIPHTFIFNRNPLARSLTRKICHVLDEKYNLVISNLTALYVSSFIQNLLEKVVMVRDDIKILFISKDGKEYSQHCVDWLYLNLNPRPSRIDSFNLHEAQSLPLYEYDMIVSDHKEQDSINRTYNVYTLNFPLYANSSILSSYYKISHNLVISMETIIGTFPKIFFNMESDIQSTKDFVHSIKDEYEEYIKTNSRQLIDDKKTINYYSANLTIIIPDLNQVNNENILIVYKNKDRKASKYKYLVYFSYNEQLNMQNLYFLKNFSDLLCDDIYIVEKLYSYLND